MGRKRRWINYGYKPGGNHGGPITTVGSQYRSDLAKADTCPWMCQKAPSEGSDKAVPKTRDPGKQLLELDGE